jgi:hypothetical protein
MGMAIAPFARRTEVDIADDDHERNGAHERALFPVWSTPVFRGALVLGVLLVLSIPALLWAWERTPYVAGNETPVNQAVKFDHRHHVRDDGIACSYCHADFRRSASAGMPAVSVCMGCHSQIWTNSNELALVRAAYYAGTPLVWERVTRLPHFVFFDHSIHVSRGVGCVSCHGRVDQMAEVYAVHTLTMDFCLDCHRSPAEQLRPLDQVENMGWTANESSTASAIQLQRTLDAYPRTDCTTCHR